MIDESVSQAAAFNRHCACAGTDVGAVRRRLDATMAAQAPVPPILETHPHLFSELPVFVAAQHARAMQEIVAAVEVVSQLPAFRAAVLARAPAIARLEQRTRGGLLGFDFHLSAQGPKLIEINTNPGGALLNVAMRREQQVCCSAVAAYLRDTAGAAQLEEEIVGMFLREWRLARGGRPLRTIAIVDENPRDQYLHPEFLLFQRLFEVHGIKAVIVDPGALSLADGKLMCDGVPIDLVYNRLTDFYLREPRHAILARAYELAAAVFTPHPQAHAVYSDKRNLAILSDAQALRSMGAVESDVATLVRGVPRTLAVVGGEQQWWDSRKQWFFKPTQGFGSRGSYRGDKLTRRVFAEVMAGEYVAQEFAAPSERSRGTGVGEVFKIDVRNYAYEGRTHLMAARLYQGQTTNFRTAGGGFAAVYVIPAPPRH